MESLRKYLESRCEKYACFSSNKYVESIWGIVCIFKTRQELVKGRNMEWNRYANIWNPGVKNTLVLHRIST